MPCFRLLLLNFYTTAENCTALLVLVLISPLFAYKLKKQRYPGTGVGNGPCKAIAIVHFGPGLHYTW